MKGRPSSLLYAVEPNHFESRTIDEERKTGHVAHADKVGAVLDERDEIPTVPFRALTVAEVAHDLGGANHIAGLVLDWRYGEGNQNAATVAADSLGFVMFDLFPRLQAGHDLFFLVDQVRRDHERDMPADGLFSSETEKAFGSGIPTLDNAVE